MQAVVGFVSEFIQGFRDSVAFRRALFIIQKQPGIKGKLYMCFKFNGLVFLGSIAFMQLLVLPLVSGILRFVGIDPAAFSVILMLVYNLFWLFPVAFLGSFFNQVWYKDIATAASIVMHPGQASATNLKRVQAGIVDLVRSLLFNLIAISEFIVLLYLPVFGMIAKTAAVALNTWLYAFLVADLAWSSTGLRLAQRIDLIEANWPYFLGFGAVLSAISLSFPFFIYTGIVALLQPVFVLMACAAQPPARSAVPKLPVFVTVRYVVGYAERGLVSLYSRLSRRRQQQRSGAGAAM